MHTNQQVTSTRAIAAPTSRGDIRGGQTTGQATRSSAQRAAVGLGWFSLGLGLGLVAIPDLMAQAIGVRPNRLSRTAMRAVGLRELAAGVGILAAPRTRAWMWSRVTSDVIDLALLGNALLSRRSNRLRLGMALASLAGVTLMDATTAQGLTERSQPQGSEDVHLTKAITVNRPTEAVYQFWHDFENLPRFMEHLESVRVEGGISRWRVEGPAGTTFEWAAELVVDRPNDTIAWRSLNGSEVSHSGSVHFRPAMGGRATEVLVDIKYKPPAGTFGRSVAALFGEEPLQQLETDLLRFKQVMETGEVMVSEPQRLDGPED